ncbi:hypothetical protein SNEBB_001242 [Seison nebaliae]|nr:hypothetical protein SNEBB_001242 [Seison nebaliae]
MTDVDMEVNNANVQYVDERKVYRVFMQTHTTYDLMPTSSKLVVFDTDLLVKKAFFALVYNGVRAAPLWNTRKKCFVGMLTITDFIKILHKYYKKPGEIDELEQHKIQTWRDELLEYQRPFIYIKPESSLLDAICSLTLHHVHRLPIMDSEAGNVLYIITHKRILRFLFLYFHDIPMPSFMEQTLAQLGIGTFSKLSSIRMSSTIYEALEIFVTNQVSALPVVDENNRLIDLYAKFDVIHLAASKSYSNLDVTIETALEQRNSMRQISLVTCRLEEKFIDVLKRIVEAEVHRLVVVDADNHVLGILSLSDILSFITMDEATCKLEAKTLPVSILIGLGIGLYDEFLPFLRKEQISLTTHAYQRELPMPKILFCYVGKFRKGARSIKEEKKIKNYLFYADNLVKLRTAKFSMLNFKKKLIVELLDIVLVRLRRKYERIKELLCARNISENCMENKEFFKECTTNEIMHNSLLYIELQINELETSLKFSMERISRKVVFLRQFIVNGEFYMKENASDIYLCFLNQIKSQLMRDSVLFNQYCIISFLTQPLNMALSTEYTIFYQLFFQIIYYWEDMIIDKYMDLKRTLIQLMELFIGENDEIHISQTFNYLQNEFIMLWKYYYIHHGNKVGWMNEKEFNGNFSKVLQLLNTLILPSSINTTKSFGFINQLRNQFSHYLMYQLDINSSYYSKSEDVAIADNEVYPEEILCTFNGKKCEEKFKRNMYRPEVTCIQYFFNETQLTSKSFGLHIIFNMKTYQMSPINDLYQNAKGVGISVLGQNEEVDEFLDTELLPFGTKNEVKMKLFWYKSVNYDKTLFPNGYIRDYGHDLSLKSCYTLCIIKQIEQRGNCKVKLFSTTSLNNLSSYTFCQSNLKDIFTNMVFDYNEICKYCELPRFIFEFSTEIQIKSMTEQLPDSIETAWRNCNELNFEGKCLTRKDYQSSLVQINFQWSNTEFDSLEQYYLKPLHMFVVGCGGICALIFGMSILTIVELLEICFIFIVEKMSPNKIRKN